MLWDYGSRDAAFIERMSALEFREYLSHEDQGYIITTFRYPDSERFSFTEFYSRLNTRGFAIYPGKLTDADCFRIGHIGRLSADDCAALLAAVAEVVSEMGIEL